MSGGGEAPPADPETSEIISASRRTQRVALYAPEALIAGEPELTDARASVHTST